MNKNYFFALFFILLAPSQVISQNTFDEKWEKVESLELEGKTTSANKIVENIYQVAKEKHREAQIIKSLFYLSKFAMTLQEDPAIQIKKLFIEEIKDASPAIRAILHSILAEFYAQYLDENNWKNKDRTTTLIRGKDFRDWNNRILTNQIVKHYQKSLQNKKLLQKTKLKRYEDLVVELGVYPLKIKTLFELLSYRALAFYGENLENVEQPVDHFKIEPTRALLPPSGFISLEFRDIDSLSTSLNALKTFQELERFYLDQEIQPALANAAVKRFNFVNHKTTVAPTVLINLFRTLIETFKDEKALSILQAELAQILKRNATKKRFPNAKKEAVAFCEKVISTKKDSLSVENCKSLLVQIKEPELYVKIEKVIPSNQFSKMLVNYKNIASLKIKIYKIELLKYSYLDKKLNGFYSHDLDSIYKQYSKTENPIYSQVEQLPNKKDYFRYSTELPLPKMEKGSYLIFASAPNYKNTPFFAAQIFQVSNFSLTTKEKDDQLEYQVLNRTSGKPIEAVKIKIEGSRERKYPVSEILTSNSQGKASFLAYSGSFDLNYLLTKKGDTLLLDANQYLPKNSSSEEEIVSKAFLFTDRSIYRPGQKMYFKGIVILKNEDHFKVVPNRYFQIIIKDANNSKLKTFRLKTNEFGSFQGEYTIPMGLRTGEFSIEIVEDDIDYSDIIDDFKKARISFSVEEYKRPKFQISFHPVEKKYRVNENITIHGQAKAYFGAAISNAKLTYRVIRTTLNNFQPVPYIRRRFATDKQEIANGSLKTDGDGNFEIRFFATPDQQQDSLNLPIFNYEVEVSVTDINGETRSNSAALKLGYHAIDLGLNAPQKVRKGANLKLRLSAKNLSGEPVEIEGKIAVYKLKSPNRILKTRSWDAPDLPSIPKKEFKEKFPHEAYTNEDEVSNWKKAKKILSKKLDLKGENELLLPETRSWKPGKYIALLQTTDEFGNLLKEKAIFSVFSDTPEITSDKVLFDYFILNKNFRKDGFVKLKLITSTESLWVRTEAFHNSQLIKDELLHLNNSAEIIKIPVGKDFTDRISLRFSFIKYNSAKKIRAEIPFPDTKPEMQIHLTTFRNKIRPGQKETWTVHITNSDPSKQVELLASMYDISLDQFKTHQWTEDLQFEEYYYFRSIPNLDFIGLGNREFEIFRKHLFAFHEVERILPILKTFGFSYNNFPYSNYGYLTRLLFPDTKPKYQFISEGGKIKGTVLSLINRQPLPGVNIILSGADNLTQTNMEGEFAINTNKGDRIIPSYLGFKTGGLFLWKDGHLTIFMVPSHSALEEVVMANYGRPVEVAEMITIRGTSAFQILPPPNPVSVNLEIKTRKNLQETTFFFPQLRTDENGNVKIEFETPEALTQWKLMLFAHNKKAESAYKEATTITQKELMITPNAPRFLREKDTIHISAKITNLSSQNQSGIAQLQIFDALNNKQIPVLNTNNLRKFSVPKNGNTQVSWQLIIPKGVQAIRYKAMAKTDDFTDGIENILPVLTNRTLVTETLAFWVRPNSTEDYYLEKLAENTSSTLENHSLTLEYTSNPVWYAIQSLPYLIRFPYDCSEQIFAKYYANSLAFEIANSNPKIKQVFKSWRKNGNLKSNLQKNQELKSILLKETPWVLEAKTQAERQQQIASLFNPEKVQNALSLMLSDLEDIQLNNGAFPWFQGGRPNFFITSHIVAGFGHLEKLGALNKSDEIDEINEKAISFLDEEFLKKYKEGNPISAIHYLYTRSFYLEDYPFSKEIKPVIDEMLSREKKSWLRNGLYAKGMLALIFYRMGEKELAKDIIVSMKENAIGTKESGMYWRANENGRFWYNSAIETQALLIEAFSEVLPKDPSIDEMKIWLLKNKRTNSWKSTKATTEAIYALLLQGKDWLEENYNAEIQIGKKHIVLSEENKNKEVAGTGNFKKVWNSEEITPEMAHIKVENKSNVPSYGGLYWQYFEDLDKISGAQNSEIEMTKQLFLKENTGYGPTLIPIDEKTVLEVGDLVTVRIELEINSRFEYVHLKDTRAAGLEPVNVLSTHKHQDGLWYYESTKDVATHFFFDVLPKGNYVFEHDLRVNNAGQFSNGITTIQSMYAPEFTSHSKGIRLSVEK